MLSGFTFSKRVVPSVFVAGVLLSAQTWATDIVGKVKKASDSTTVISGVTVILAAGVVRDTVVTDSTGSFTFPSVTAGNRSVAASLTGYFPVTVNTTVNTANDFDTVNVYMAVSVPGTITGKVANAFDSIGISGAKIYLRRTSATSAILDSLTTDSTGTYTFVNVTPGTPNYWLNVTATGLIAGARTNLAVPNGGTATSNFFLLTPATITGIVRNAADSTTTIRNVMIVRRRGSANGTPIDTATTNIQGAYTFNNVTPGTPNYWLTATQSNFLTLTNANVVVPNGAAATSNFYLTAAIPSSIEGKVINATDSTPVDAWLYLRRTSATSAIVDSTETISTGAYAFGSVTPGTPNYWITVVATGYANGTRNNLTIPNSSTVTVNFALNPVIIDAVFSPVDFSSRIHFIRMGNQLALDVGVSTITRTVDVYSLSGKQQLHVSIPAGVSRAMVPGALAPENGFLFNVK